MLFPGKIMQISAQFSKNSQFIACFMASRPASPAAHPNLPRQRRRASCRLVNAFVM